MEITREHGLAYVDKFQDSGGKQVREVALSLDCILDSPEYSSRSHSLTFWSLAVRIYFTARVENLSLEPLVRNPTVFAKWLATYLQGNEESAKVLKVESRKLLHILEKKLFLRSDWPITKEKILNQELTKEL